MNELIGERGFFLTETIVSILILTLVMLLAFPILTQTYYERLTLEKQTEAISLLRYQLLLWKNGETSAALANGSTTYQLEWRKQTADKAVLCIVWEDRNRSFEICSEAVR